MKEVVTIICSIAVSHAEIPSALISATMVIGLCAEKFSEPAEKQALLSVLDKTEEIHKWPVEAARAEIVL